MYTFIICLLVLILSYFVYGKLIEKVVGVDASRETPVWRLEDGVDYAPMSRFKNGLIHFLNIAGLGPIFGAIQGALFGPAAFLWIVFGTIFIGAVHDFFSGFLSLRNDGLTMPEIISKYLGKTAQKIIAFVTIVSCVLVASTFANGAASLLTNLTNVPVTIWLIIIFVYFLIAMLFSVDKIIGKIYPIFGLLFIIMTVLVMGSLLLSPNLTIPELTTQGLYLTDKSIFPYLFVTISCGAISGFHASQSPIVARCMKNEKDARPVFYGAMVLEGISALIWAAAALAVFHGQPQIALLYGSTPAVAAHDIATMLLNPIGVFLVVLGIIVCPITTGDTALRGSRITIADELHLDQKKLISRVKLSVPLFIVSFALAFVDFSIIWRYVAWIQLLSAVAILLAATVYLIEKNKPYIFTLVPAMVCMVISFAYILQSSDGFGLPAMISNVISIIATGILTVLFLKYYDKLTV